MQDDENETIRQKQTENGILKQAPCVLPEGPPTQLLLVPISLQPIQLYKINKKSLFHVPNYVNDTIRSIINVINLPMAMQCAN